MHAALAQAAAHLAREERQLVRPHAAGNAEQEHPVGKRDGLSVLRDARPYGGPPELVRDARARSHEPALAGAAEDRPERFGRAESARAGTAGHGERG